MFKIKVDLVEIKANIEGCGRNYNFFKYGRIISLFEQE